MRIFNGNIQKIENAVIEDYIDPFSIPELKILVSKGRDRIEIQNKANTNLRNHTNLGDGSGGNYIQIQGLPRLEKSQGFKVGVAGGAETSASWGNFFTSDVGSMFMHFKTLNLTTINQRILLLNGNPGVSSFEIVITIISNMLYVSRFTDTTGTQTFQIVLSANTEYTLAFTTSTFSPFKIYLNGEFQTSFVGISQSGFGFFTINKLNSSTLVNDVIFGSFLLAETVLTEKTIKQLDNKILNLGYL